MAKSGPFFHQKLPKKTGKLVTPAVYEGERELRRSDEKAQRRKK
jgi:hypothetical protein